MTSAGPGRRPRAWLDRLPIAAPTARGVGLLVAALVPLAVGVHRPVLVVPGLVLAAAAYSLVVADRLLAPGAARLRVRREHEPSFGLGRPGQVTLRVRALGLRRPTRALIRDEHPADIPASAAVHVTWLRPDDETELRYTLTPPARGERFFGDATLRVEGPLRLAARQTTLDLGHDRVLVDPDLSGIRAYEALVRRGQLAEMGVRALRRGGEGTDFERVRDAVPEDPLRAINWRATARTGRLMATELRPERAQPVIVCIDHGRLMGVGAGALTKLDHAIGAALLLVHVALRTGDRVGLLAFSERVTAVLPPRSGRAQLGAVLEAVRPLRPGEVEPDYDEAFETLSRRQARRALVAVFTDVVDPDQGQALVAQCSRLRRRHLVLVVCVRDPALDAAGQRRPDDTRAVYARAVASGLLADRSDVLRSLRRAGVDVLDADARALSPRLVNRYLELKRRARL